ncbi:hypothetical protein F183_A28750 [Bryobacterales bacterium F-183]|nr:hypothetical protein F183_A28750 [Bryobacterales bacterium F-183]
MLALSSISVAQAQQQTSPTALDGRLKVLVLEGVDAANVIEGTRGVMTVVEVRDANDHPVPQAQVTFRLPVAGPSGTFTDGRLILTVRTNTQGQAAAIGFRPNTSRGSFQMSITAQSDNRVGVTEVRQFNVADESTAYKAGQPSKRWKVYLVIGAAAAGAATGVLLTRNGNSSAVGGTPVLVSPGTIGVTSPR